MLSELIIKLKKIEETGDRLVYIPDIDGDLCTNIELRPVTNNILYIIAIFADKDIPEDEDNG